MANDRQTVLSGIAWPDGTVVPEPGMYLGVQDPTTLQFFNLPPVGDGVTSVGVTGASGITVVGSPIISTGDISIGLGDITPQSISTGNAWLTGNLAIQAIDERKVISGDFSNPDASLRTVFQSGKENTPTIVTARPTGTANPSAAWSVENAESGAACAGSSLYINQTSTGIQSYVRTGGTPLPFYLITGAGAGFGGIVQDVLGNVVIGGNINLVPNSTSRFFYLNGMPGMPTAKPVVPIGNEGPLFNKVPVTVDLNSNKVYFYVNNAWRNTNTPDYFEVSATAGQTVFNMSIRTFPKGSGKSYLQVFVNGIFQQEGATKEYRVTGVSQITFNNGIAAGADVVIYGFG